MNWTNEALFCLKYLYERGYCEGWNIQDTNLLLQSAQVNYQLVQLPKGDFFSQLAHGLRELWPSGDKDGKYPWRDSEANLVKRLQVLWNNRHLDNYSLDDCLRAARRYLSQYEDNVKYMQILKYFILKQKSIVEPNGKIRYINESKFADMLESQEKLAVPDDWEMTTTLVEQGELV